jgi:hypothetical protein
MRGSPCAQAPSCSRAERGNSQSRAPAALGLRTSLSPRSVPKSSLLASCLTFDQGRKVGCFLACLEEMQGSERSGVAFGMRSHCEQKSDAAKEKVHDM